MLVDLNRGSNMESDTRKVPSGYASTVVGSAHDGASCCSPVLVLRVRFLIKKHFY